MTSASRIFPKVHLALEYLIRNFFRVENVDSVRLAMSNHKLPPVAYADSCELVRYDNDVSPGLRYHEAEGTALNMCHIIGSAQSMSIQCVKSTKLQAGLDHDMAKCEELADARA
eukprot:465706-Pyramimonas_sp.AAC.1